MVRVEGFRVVGLGLRVQGIEIRVEGRLLQGPNGDNKGFKCNMSENHYSRACSDGTSNNEIALGILLHYTTRYYTVLCRPRLY